MTACYQLPLDLPLLGSELLRHDLSEARGILWGAGLGVVVWTGLLYLALGSLVQASRPTSSSTAAP